MPVVVNLPMRHPAAPRGGGPPLPARPTPVKRQNSAPAVDWTGHTYKAPADLLIDYNHHGRESIPPRTKDPARQHPII